MAAVNPLFEGWPLGFGRMPFEGSPQGVEGVFCPYTPVYWCDRLGRWRPLPTVWISGPASYAKLINSVPQATEGRG